MIDVKFFVSLEKTPKRLITIFGLFLIAVLGVVDYITSWEISFSIFYLIPVIMMSWFAGKEAGLLASVASALAAFLAEFFWDVQYAHPFVPYWNAGTLLFIFLLIVQLLSTLKSHMEGLETIVAERTAALTREIGERELTEQSLIQSNETLKTLVHARKKAEEMLLSYQEQLSSLAVELSLSEERERRRFATELHDQLGQNLTFVKMKLDDISCQAASASCARSIEVVGELVEQIIQNVRSLTFQISPPLLYEIGLESALEWLGEEFQEKYGLHVEIRNDGEKKPLNIEIRTAIFHIVRELLVNVVKHAHTSRVSVALQKMEGMILIEVNDAGAGFDFARAETGEKRPGGFGLFNIRQRIVHLGGSMHIESAMGHGTRIVLQAPLSTEIEAYDTGRRGYHD